MVWLSQVLAQVGNERENQQPGKSQTDHNNGDVNRAQNPYLVFFETPVCGHQVPTESGCGDARKARVTWRC